MQQSASSIYEKHLINSMFPNKNKTALRFAYDVYQSSLGEAFHALFSHLAAGSGWDAAESNTRPLVSHFHACILHCVPPTGEEAEWSHILSQLDSIADKLTGAAEKNPEIAHELQKDATYVREVIGEIEKSSTNIRYSTITGIILSNWDWLGNYTRTFRLLASVSKIAKGLQSDAEKRVGFVRILQEISGEWTH